MEDKRGLCTDYRIGKCINDQCPWDHKDCRYGIDCENTYFRGERQTKCPFGHPSHWEYSNQVCYHFNTSRGCMYGDNCKKQHVKMPLSYFKK